MSGNGQDHSKGKEPVERVMDLFVHMPIGFAVMAWKRVPEFVVAVPGMVGEVLSKSCAQFSEAEDRLSEEVRKARMIGQVAVTFGGRQLRREVDARLRDVRQAAGGVASFVPGAGAGGPNGASGGPAGGVTATATPTEPASAPPVDVTAPKSPPKAAAPTGASNKATRAPRKAVGARKTAKASPANLPIREYDGLSASQVVSRLTGLTPEELRAVRGYEDASRGRRTVLLAIDRLLG